MVAGCTVGRVGTADRAAARTADKAGRADRVDRSWDKSGRAVAWDKSADNPDMGNRDTRADNRDKQAQVWAAAQAGRDISMYTVDSWLPTKRTRHPHSARYSI